MDDAVAGGYVVDTNQYTVWLEKFPIERLGGRVHVVRGTDAASVAEILLDPKAWAAVGKTRGWKEKSENTFEAEMACWQAYWTGFYSHLADGKTIEEALAAISEQP